MTSIFKSIKYPSLPQLEVILPPRRPIVQVASPIGYDIYVFQQIEEVTSRPVSPEKREPTQEDVRQAAIILNTFRFHN